MTTLMKTRILVLWTSWLILASMASVSMAAISSGESTKNNIRSPASYRIKSVMWDQTADDYILRIEGGTAPTYTMYELFEPLRVIIDIADASLDSTVTLPLNMEQGPVTLVSGKVISDKKTSITRVELFLRDDHNYLVDRVENTILVKFPKTSPATTTTGVASAPATTPTATTAAANVSEVPQGTLATKLANIEITKDPNATRVYIKADGAIKHYKKVLLGNNPKANRPDRMYLDLNNIRLSGSPKTMPVGTALAQVRTAKRQDGVRVVFDSGLKQIFDYSISEQPDGLLVTINETAPTSASSTASLSAPDKGAIPPGMTKGSDKTSQPKTASVNTAPSSPESILTATAETEPLKPSLPADALDELGIEESGNPVPKNTFTTPSPRDLTFAGYTKQRITVDFYKIDLHNVFRLFGEISNLNMVVDEAVNGSLTLALNDVPWDFALDIILNLKDLQKEERFNTIVISPKSKSFTWPERALDNVEFKSDIKIQQADKEQGGLKISKRIEVPEAVVEAKKLVHQANLSEQKGDYANALLLYEEAFTKWTENVNLARRIAAMSLVNLEQNAKAVYYAKVVLKLIPGDHDAALQAAIGLARMKKDAEAKEFFITSVSGDKPPGEALVSYSSFCEEQQDFDCSLSLLKRHEDLYGDTVDTMVTKARIYDKQGNQDQAAQEYRTILLSGYELPADLARYVKGRAAFAGR